MTDAHLQSRLARIEQRLARIEARLGLATSPRPAAASPAEAPTARSHADHRAADGAAAPRPTRNPSSLATSVLGWAGVMAFVLAAAYLIRLGIDNGWLTPQRQVGMAVVAGVLLIGAGFALRRSQPGYAGYLPACGVAIVFLSIYAAHLFYGFIGVQAAGLFVVMLCAASLWLCKAFDSDLYALFAVVGSYSAPFLLAGASGTLTDVVIYFSAWSVVFSTYGIWRGRRPIYLLALYLALVGFSVIWQTRAPGQWIAGMIFQAVQFVVFGIAVVVYSVRWREPLDTRAALAHLPPLLLFYALQYAVLDRHLPALAPWISVLSLAAVGALYAGARRWLRRPLPGGELLLWCYLSLVLFHAGYLEAWPDAWAPWASFIVVPAAVLATARRKEGVGPLWVLWVTVAAIFALNYVRVITGVDMRRVPGHAILPLAYAALLYAGYYLVSGREGLRQVKLPLVYGGHLGVMAAAVHLLHAPIVESTAWGLLALACLGLSMWRNDRLLGQSSLLVFGAAAAKVLLVDLSGAQPLARIVSLVVLGVTFYVGGMLYQRLVAGRGAAQS